VANERKEALKACRQFLYDLNADAPVIDEDVIKLHLGSGLNALNEWRPLRKLLPLTMDPTKFDYDLPSDFLTIELASFNAAVNPANLNYNWNGYQYELGTQAAGKQLSGGFSPLPGLGSIFPFSTFTQPYQQAQSVAFGVGFIPGSRFEFVSKDDGTPLMLTSPKPPKAGPLSFVYQAQHRVTDDSGPDPEAVGFVAGVNTVPVSDRDMLWAKVGELSAVSMQRKMAGDRYASRNFGNLAERCATFFTDRAAVFTWGG